MNDNQKNAYETFKLFSIMYKLRAVEKLMLWFEEYLGCTSLQHKLYIYCAITLHHVLMDELTSTTGIQFFRQIQDRAITQWNAEHKDKIRKILDAIMREARTKRGPEFVELKKIERQLAAIQVCIMDALEVVRSGLRSGKFPPTQEAFIAELERVTMEIRKERGCDGKHLFEMNDAELQELADKSKARAEERKKLESKAAEPAPVSAKPADPEEAEEDEEEDGDANEDDANEDANEDEEDLDN
jgi:hypothetical protein